MTPKEITEKIFQISEKWNNQQNKNNNLISIHVGLKLYNEIENDPNHIFHQFLSNTSKKNKKK